jgi:hypothetical protein
MRSVPSPPATSASLRSTPPPKEPCGRASRRLDGPTLRRCRPAAVSSRLTPSRRGQWQKLAAPEPQPTDGKIRGEERADAHPGSRGLPPPRPLRPRVRRASRRSVSHLEEAINPLGGYAARHGRRGGELAFRFLYRSLRLSGPLTGSYSTGHPNIVFDRVEEPGFYERV